MDLTKWMEEKVNAFSLTYDEVRNRCVEFIACRPSVDAKFTHFLKSKVFSILDFTKDKYDTVELLHEHTILLNRVAREWEMPPTAALSLIMSGFFMMSGETSKMIANYGRLMPYSPNKDKYPSKEE